MFAAFSTIVAGPSTSTSSIRADFVVTVVSVASTCATAAAGITVLACVSSAGVVVASSDVWACCVSVFKVDEGSAAVAATVAVPCGAHGADLGPKIWGLDVEIPSHGGAVKTGAVGWSCR